MGVLGIDVGGTNTDIVFLHQGRVNFSCKVTTTTDIISGIRQALQQCLASPLVHIDNIDMVSLGTTHFLNAVLQNPKQLSRVAAIRLCLPSSSFLTPFTAWPDYLNAHVNGGHYLLPGGYQFNNRLIAPLNEKKLLETIRYIRNTGVTQIALSCIFSNLNGEMERQAAALIRDEWPDVGISMSHQIGQPGLLERENATIINASLKTLAQTVMADLQQLFHSAKIQAPIYLCQNDGTMQTLKQALDYPIFTFSSGPTNSLRGAAYLTGIANAFVVDIGGTTTDIGLIKHNFPVERRNHSQYGCVRTNFSAPDVVSLAIGGGSIICHQQDHINVGPQSVADAIVKKALCFGGDTETATDAAVAAGLTQLGHCNPNSPKHRQILDIIHRRISQSLEQVRHTSDPLPLILVGGGTFLLPNTPGCASHTILPENADVANAVGAAIAEISGEYECVYYPHKQDRQETLEQAKQYAKEQAIQKGASADQVKILDINEQPIPYLPDNPHQLRIRAVGPVKASIT